MTRKNIAFPVVAALCAVMLFGCGRNDQSNQTTVTASSAITSDDASAGSDFNSNPSDAPRINVKLVEQALSQVQKSDPDGWVNDFRQRVNEIYDGDDVVSVDAHPDASKNLEIIGYISHSGKEGYQADTDEQLFTVEQTGAVANDQTPYQMTYATYGGSYSYYNGYYHNPFLTAWYIHALTTPTWHGYYTSPAHIIVVHNYRNTYRTTPAYHTEREATHAYYHQEFHAVPIVTQPGSSLGTGVKVNKTVTPVKVAEPPHFDPHATLPHRTVTPSTSTTHTQAAAPAAHHEELEHKSGGLFNKSTFSNSRPKPFSTPKPTFRSSGSRRR